MTDEPGIGFDFDITGRERGLLVEAHHRDVERNIQRRCGDFDDFHEQTAPIFRLVIEIAHLSTVGR